MLDSFTRVIKELFIRTAERFLISLYFLRLCLSLWFCFCFFFISAPRRTWSLLTHAARCVWSLRSYQYICGCYQFKWILWFFFFFSDEAFNKKCGEKYRSALFSFILALKVIISLLHCCLSAVSTDTVIMLRASSEEHAHTPALEPYYPYD